MQPEYEVAQVLQRLGKSVSDLGLNTWQLRTLLAIERCRTSALGGHIDACDSCGNISISYNSCRNRHCNKCQGHKKEEWILARESDLLPVPYFHRSVGSVVFTLPQELNPLTLYQTKEVYDSLFQASWQTIETFGKKKGVQMGMISVLHSWGQNLSLHPHVHCIVPGGGVDGTGNWQSIHSDGKFLFPVKALSKVFRAKCVGILSQKIELDKALRESLFKKDWVVYAKRPFSSPKSVVEYLGKYTHKVAISNHRLKSIEEERVTFSYKDYRSQGEKKVMSFTHQEFIRRFAQHILPKRFVRIRPGGVPHYGILSSTWKREKLVL